MTTVCSGSESVEMIALIDDLAAKLKQAAGGEFPLSGDKSGTAEGDFPPSVEKIGGGEDQFPPSMGKSGQSGGE